MVGRIAIFNFGMEEKAVIIEAHYTRCSHTQEGLQHT